MEANTYLSFQISVAELKLNRPLKSGEVVHHKDRNKKNKKRNSLNLDGQPVYL